jgi:hypothetical protein
MFGTGDGPAFAGTCSGAAALATATAGVLVLGLLG